MSKHFQIFFYDSKHNFKLYKKFLFIVFKCQPEVTALKKNYVFDG